MLKLILCIDSENGISRNNTIPWNFIDDLNHFKNTTINHTVVMGRKTFQTLTNPLPNRKNIVFSTQKNMQNSDVEFTDNLDYVIDLSKKEDVFIIGGKSIAQLFFPYIDEIILSKANENYHCDSFVELDLKNFECYETKSFSEFTIKWYRKTNSKLLYGSTIADEEIKALKDKTSLLVKKYKILPTLAIISFDDNFSSISYINAKQKMANLIGVKILIYKITEPFFMNLKNKIIELNSDKNIHGILVQHPFPLNVNVNEICSLINPYKDVDCFNPLNISKIWFWNKEKNNCILPCTPNAIIKILKFYKIQIANKRVVIVGRSIIVGKPLFLLFLNENATVTICHSKTIDLKNICQEADILICAIGKAKFFDDSYIKKDAIVIDVGVNKTIDNIICGDVDFDKVYDKASYITPVPKGVGPVTLIELYSNLLNIYESILKRESQIIIEENKLYQPLHSKQFNIPSRPNAVSDITRFLNAKENTISLEKKTVFDLNNLDKKIVDFTNNEKIKIGIFSSSSDLGSKLQERVKRSKKILEDNDFIVNLGNLWNKSTGYTTASSYDRAMEFNSLIDANDILMSMIGGMNSSSILEYINYGKLINRKTKVIGFSDTTAILLAIYTKTKLPVYYGPALLPSFDEQQYIKDWNINSFKKYVVNDYHGVIDTPEYWTEEKIDWIEYKNGYGEKEKIMLKNKMSSINDGVVVGRLIGGNLNTMISIYNTEYMPKIQEGDILFFEDSNKSADECERSFAFLKNSKILEKVSGVIIGKCEGFNSMNSNETYMSLFLKFLDRKIPVLMNYDCSHCQPMNVLKIGGKIKLDTFEKKIYLLN